MILSLLKLVTLLLAVVLFFPASSVYGHGLGIDTISSVDIQGKEITISVELPLSFDNLDEKQITITATEDETRENAKNVTFLIGLFHENQMIFRNYFFTSDGVLPINVKPSADGEISINGEQDSLLGAWYGTESNPLEITGPIFNSGGLYNFEIEVRTLDEPTNIIENSGVYNADLSVAETTQYTEKDSENQDVSFRLKSYFDKISSFEYDSEKKQVTFVMPFDWSEKQMSHIPVVHEEVHFPNEFAEFFSPGYTGKVNGIDLFKSSVTIDDYTEEDERIVHFVLLQDHLRFLKNQMKKSGEPLPDNIVFTLSTNEKIDFPLTAYTKSEEFLVNLSWDPITIQPDTTTKFVFTIRDGATNEPLRNSDYTFVILQGGKEIHRVTGFAQVGGDSEDYYFTEDQTGPTIIRFENIRNTGQETEFGMVVAPEFGTIAGLILMVSIISVIILSKKMSLTYPKF
jgi:predicted secreted protein with PEFG-CTERM motif